jgi:GNAT superfamily N-acetyltransferase
MIRVEIRPFEPENQEKVEELILNGLKEHWGYLDESKNPDLKNIAVSYSKATFLVAWYEDRIVGTGAFIPHSEAVVEIVRMSVLKELQRQTIGQQILYKLCQRAYRDGYKKAILETTKTWQGVIAFYQQFGFQITHYLDGDVYFSLDLPELFTKPQSEM